ncbi:MAG: glycosyltransferase [Amphibacillus sp.]|nr:glycosyltransferase [Amphibacillus sp.]
MGKIKILFFIYQMGAGGAARTLLNIINNLDREKYQPVLVTLDYNGSYESEIKDDVIFKKVNTQRLSRSIFKLAKIIRTEKINVVFSTIPRVNTIAILATHLSFTKAKCVVREASNLDGNFIERLKLRAFGCIYKLSDQVISLSEGVKKNLVERYKLKPKDIKVIYNPIDINEIQNKIATEQLKSEYQALFQSDRKTIINVGRLVPQKDQATLIKAFAKINEQIKSRLIILGEGPLLEDLTTLTQDLNVSEHVHFVGFQHNPYLFFESADLFVLTSKFEGFGHVLAEALATGTPVVSTNCKSGPAEILENGKYGRLVEVGNVDEIAENILAILNLAKQPLNDIINKGYQRVQFFNADKIVKQYQSTFENLIQ